MDAMSDTEVKYDKTGIGAGNHDTDDFMSDLKNLENLPLGIYVIDPDSNLIYMNRSAREKMTVQFIEKTDKCTSDNSGQQVIPRSISNTEEHRRLLKQTDSLLFSEFDRFLSNHFLGRQENREEEKPAEQILGKIGHEINNFLTVLQLRSEMMKMSYNDGEKVLKNIDQLFDNIRNVKHYASNLLYIGRKQLDSPTLYDLVKFYEDFIIQPDISVLFENSEISFNKDSDRFLIESDMETLSVLFLNGLLLGQLFIPPTKEINLDFYNDKLTRTIAFRYRTDSFPENDFKLINTSNSIDDFKLSSLNVSILSIVNAARTLNARIDISDITDTHAVLKIMVPVNR